MGLLGAAISSLAPEEILKIVAQYGPVIEALIQFIEIHKDDKLRALSMDSVTRGLQYATQTGDTTQLSDAIRNHCDSSGCLFP